MREKVMLVLKLIDSGLNLNEIQKELNISNSEMNKILKLIREAGYNYTRTIFSDGNIILKLNKTLNFGERKSVRINVKDRVLRAIFISDLHIGSIYEKPENIRVVYEYALSHDCHIIFNGGDVIENIYQDSPHPPLIKTADGQARHYMRMTPFHEGLLYLNLYGNHDYKSVQDHGFDVARFIEERRYDIVSLGYGECIIHLKDDAIAIIHDLRKLSKNEIPNNVSAVYRGHSHKSKTRDNKIIYIPSLSDNDTSAYEFRPLPGFLDAEFIFFDKKIARINMKQLAIVNKEIRLANEETMILQPEYQDRRKKLTKNP